MAKELQTLSWHDFSEGVLVEPSALTHSEDSICWRNVLWLGHGTDGLSLALGCRIASSWRRSWPIATGRRSMWRGHGSSWSRPSGWTWRRSPGGPESAGRRCGAGSSASPRPASTGCCATRPGNPASRATPEAVVQRVVALTCAEPPGEATHWTGRLMAKATGLSLRTVQRIWAAHKLQPHRLRTFKRSRDPEFIDQARGHRRALPGPAAARGRAVGRREEPDPGPRPHPAGPAAQARQGRDDDPRLCPPRHDHAVRRAQRARRHGARPLHAAAPPPGVHPLPQRGRGRGPRRQAGPLHPRQLRHPQAPEGARLARPPRALDLPLHADLRLLAQRGRDLLLRDDPPPPPPRRVPLAGRPAGRHQPLPRRAQRRPQALRLDRHARTRLSPSCSI